MQTRGFSTLLIGAVFSCVLATTGCDQVDRVTNKLRSKESLKNKYMADGKKFMSEKKPREAMQRFTLAARVDPNWGEAQYQLGMAALEARDYPRGYKAFQTAVEKDPKHYEALRQLASLNLVAKKYDDAKATAEKMLAIKPKDSQAEEIIAYSLAGLGDMEGSEKELEGLVEHDPGQISANLNLARFKFRDKHTA